MGAFVLRACPSVRVDVFHFFLRYTIERQQVNVNWIGIREHGVPGSAFSKNVFRTTGTLDGRNRHAIAKYYKQVFFDNGD